MLSLGGERVVKFSELQLNDTPHTAYGFGGLKQGVRVCEKQLIFIYFITSCLHRKCTCSIDSFIFII